MSNELYDFNIGHSTAYAYAKASGDLPEGMTPEEYGELLAAYATVGQTAVDAKNAAVAANTAAQTAATTATNKASEATTAAQTATTKAAEAQADADAAALDASQALSAASTATTKATEATTAAATATSAASTATTAKDDAVSAKTAAQTAQTGAETAAASVQSSAAQIATNTDDIAQLKKDLSDVNERLDTDFNYLANGVFDVPFVQGARGTDGTIRTNSKYLTSQLVYDYPAGTKLTLDVTTSGAQAIITQWTKSGEYVGNLGSWGSHIDYTFSDKNITITLKKGTEDITPSSITTSEELITPFTNIYKLSENDFEYVVYDSFRQGYYEINGAYNSESNGYACSAMFIPSKNETYIIPQSDDYKISIYSWDYNNGTFSNFTQTGWISSDNRVEVTQGKAMALVLADKTSTTIVAGDIDYTFYLITPIGDTIKKTKLWTPRKVACIGDSLTQGVDVGSHVIKENYPYFMSNTLGCTVLNCGVAGADTKEYWHDNMDDFTFDSSLDTVLIMLGTNGGGIPNTLATDVYPYTDYNDYADTYCGCYCKIIRKIIELTQNRAQVILITPPYTTYSTQQLDRVKTARETIKEIGLYYNIPVIDVFAECGMGAYNASVFRPHDGCHFNAKGYNRLGTFIGSKVKSLHSGWNLTDEYDDETPIT